MSCSSYAFLALTVVVAVLALVIAALVLATRIPRSVWGGGELANAALIVLDKRAQGGVNTDAKWVQQALLAAGCKHARIVGAREFSAGVPGNFRATFFIEHIPRKQSSPARSSPARSYVLVNHEFLYDWDVEELRSGRVTALCKTRAAVGVLADMGIESTYIGFGRPTPRVETPRKLNPNLVVHLAGSSPLKGTEQLLRVWEHLGDDHAKLFITAWGLWLSECSGGGGALQCRRARVERLRAKPLAGSRRRIFS